MADFTDILARATHRLRIDRELQLDVEHELRTHLQDAAAEYRDAGHPPDEADDLAARALGDPDDVADQLWRANRGRIRLRAWARWGLQLAAPVAMVLVVLFVVRQQVDVARAKEVGDRVRTALATSPAGSLYAWMDRHAAAISERESPLVAEALVRTLATAEREPGNGAFFLLAADLRAQMASDYFDDPSDGVELRNQWRTTDPAGMIEASALLRRAAAAPTFEVGITTEADRAIRDAPKPATSMGFVYGRSEGIAAVIDAQLNALGAFRRGARHMAAYARELAAAGRGDEALAVVDDLRAVSLKLIRDADMAMAMLVGVSMYWLAGEAEVDVHRALGDEAAAEQAAGEKEAFTDWFVREYRSGASPGVEAASTLGLVTRMMQLIRRSVPGYAEASRGESTPGEFVAGRARRMNAIAAAADRATLAVMALVAVAGLLLLLSGIGWLLTLVAAWQTRARGGAGPVLVLRRCYGFAAMAGVAAVMTAAAWGAMRLGDRWMVAWCATAASVMIVAAAVVGHRVRRPPLPRAVWRSSAVRTFAAACGFGALVLVGLGAGPLLYEESCAATQLQQSDLFLPGNEIERSRYAELAAWAGEELRRMEAAAGR